MQDAIVARHNSLDDVMHYARLHCMAVERRRAEDAALGTRALALYDEVNGPTTRALSKLPSLVGNAFATPSLRFPALIVHPLWH